MTKNSGGDVFQKPVSSNVLPQFKRKTSLTTCSAIKDYVNGGEAITSLIGSSPGNEKISIFGGGGGGR